MVYLSQTAGGSAPDVRSIPRARVNTISSIIRFLSFAHRSISGSSDPSISLRNGPVPR